MIEIYKEKNSLCLVDTSSKTMSTICGYGFDKLVKGLETNEYGWFDYNEHFEDGVLEWKHLTSYADFEICKSKFKTDYPEYVL